MRWLFPVTLAACGGGGEVKGDPLIQSTLMAQFDNKPWAPMYGFARVEDGEPVMYLGSAKISCADDFMGMPRDGTYSINAVPDFAIGNYASVAFTLLEVVDSDLSTQSGNGGVMITGASGADVSAVYAFSITAGSSQFSITGAVTMLRCPP